MYKYMVFILILVANSCSKTYKYDIRKKIVKICSNKNECIIDLKEISQFGWDKMIVFDEGASLSMVNKVLGFKYSNYNEFSRTILFVFKNNIVHQEKENYNPSKRYNNVWFEFPNSTTHIMKFLPNNAKFKVIRDTIDSNIYYTLRHLNSIN